MPDRPASPDEELSAAFSAECNAAREHLRREMASRGLHERDGWRISESTRHVSGRTELVMRPVHRTLAAPAELECVVSIDEPGSSIESNCPP